MKINTHQHLNFLHCMKQASYLKSAITNGLMLTEHEVSFSPSKSKPELSKLLDNILPFLNHRLSELGESLDSLNDERKKIYF